MNISFVYEPDDVKIVHSNIISVGIADIIFSKEQMRNLYIELDRLKKQGEFD